MSITKTVIAVTVGIIVLVGVLFSAYREKQKDAGRPLASDISIEKSWELPEKLEEVSGIVFMEGERMACIQDEDGTIFIYNLSTSEIEEEIDFAGEGDYEGLALAGNTAFVLRSDGKIFRIENYLSDPVVSEHQTKLTQEQDVEGLCYDPGNNRLLLAIKEEEPEASGYKGIYAVDLNTMQVRDEPVFKLHFQDPVFEEVEEQEEPDIFKPSEIAINPTNGKIFLTEGTNPKLLILDSEGKPEKLHFLDESDFPQPEGLTFDPSGNIYISNEGNPGTIHLIQLTN